MTIQIPCELAPNQLGVGQFFVTITPEIARKIVALATTEESPAVQTSPPATVVPFVVPSHMDYPRNVVPSQWASAASALGAKPVEFDKPAPVADDEATVKALWQAFDSDTTSQCAGFKAQLRKIRRGEIPGVQTTPPKGMVNKTTEFQLRIEKDALKAEVERLKAELAAAQLEAKAPRGCGWSDQHQTNELKAERDAAIARAESAESLMWTADNMMIHWGNLRPGCYQEWGEAKTHHLAKHGKKEE